MIKILILLALIGLTTTLGVFLGANKKKKMQVYSELYEFNERLLLNLKFDRNPINQVAQSFKYMPEMLEGKRILDGKDGEVIADYAVNLGKSDALSQIDYLNGRKAALGKLKEDSAAEYKRYGSLYVKIFFMIGVLAAILLA